MCTGYERSQEKGGHGCPRCHTGRESHLVSPPPPSRLTSGIEVIRFVGHSDGECGVPSRLPAGGPWTRALILPLQPVPTVSFTGFPPQSALFLLPVPPPPSPLLPLIPVSTLHF